MERPALSTGEPDLGQYQFRRLLGEGGFGQVYEAWDAKLQRSIAIKRLKPHVLSARAGNLLDEARLAASLRHPAFVKIFSIDGDADQQSIVMEFVDGNTLNRAAQQLALSEEAALDIVCQVAEAMEEAHASHLVHGDLKPSNLMLEASGKVRIMDFGLARKLDPQATETVVIGEAEGTIAYLAPELLTGGRPNAQSDVYALGVVLYELVTGERPFAHLNGLALAAAHIQSTSALWPFPPTTSPAVAALVRAMTARDLSQRLPSMQAVRDAAAAIGPDGAPPRLAPARRWQRLTPALRRRAPLLLAALALTAAFGVGLVTMATEWGAKVTPLFSESAALKKGMEALRTFDRAQSLDTAIAQFTALLDRHPDHAAAAAGLSLAYSLHYAGDTRDETWLQRADASAQLALKLNDQLALAHAAMAQVSMWKGKYDESLSAADRALRLDPNTLFALHSKATTLSLMHRDDEAERVITAAIAMYPRERLFADALGTVYFVQGAYAAAEKAYRHSIQLDPDGVNAYGNLSYALLRQNRGDEALQVLQQGLQVRPSVRLYTNLGNVLFGRGDYVGAAQAFEHAISPANGGASDYLNWANLADTLRWIPGRAEASRNAYRQAVALLKPMLQRPTVDAALMSRLGLYSARLGDRETAVDMSRRALAREPESADVRFRAAMAYEASGDRDRALAELDAARRRGYPANLISAEPDLMALRRDPRYHQPLNESVK